MYPTLLKAGAVALVALAAASAGTWNATLEPTTGNTVKGEATIETFKTDSTKFDARISVSGGTTGEELPWHVHEGACGTANAPVVGEASAYAPVKIGPDSTGRGTATVAVQLKNDAAYHVNVHKSASDQTVISCGNLALKDKAVPSGN